MNAKKISISKPIVSILELCQILQLSRARYYQLVESGFFPQPLIDDRSKRPYYDADLQAKCIEARQTGIGANGSYLLFYSPRKKETVAHVGKKKVNAQIQELTETLESMGLEVNAKQIQEALSQLFPDGTDQDQGLIIRQLYRHLKQK